MGIMRKWLGSPSQYDKSLPYIYEARVDMLSGAGDEPIYESYFCDTVCGLVEYLEANDVKPSQVQLFGVFRGEEVALEVGICSEGDRWLERRGLCRTLEAAYEKTHEQRYKGHVAGRPCSYVDRDRVGH